MASAPRDQVTPDIRWNRSRSRSSAQPQLRILEHRRTQQQTAWLACRTPSDRALCELRMLANPRDVDRQALDQPAYAFLEQRCIVEEKQVTAAEIVRSDLS